MRACVSISLPERKSSIGFNSISISLTAKSGYGLISFIKVTGFNKEPKPLFSLVAVSLENDYAHTKGDA